MSPKVSLLHFPCQERTLISYVEKMEYLLIFYLFVCLWFFEIGSYVAQTEQTHCIAEDGFKFLTLLLPFRCWV